MAAWGNRSKNGASTEDMLEHENQRMTENLASKMSRLKGIAFDIETETKDSNRYLSGMGSDFDSSEGLLSGSMKRMDHMISSGKNNKKIMCYLILILVGVFIICYYFILRIRAG